MPPNGFGEQRGEIFGLLADESVEGGIFTWADPSALGSAPVAPARLAAGETAGTAIALRVRLDCEPRSLNRPKMCRIVDRRGADLAV